MNKLQQNDMCTKRI